MNYSKTLFTHAVFNTASAFVHLDAFKDFCKEDIQVHIWANRMAQTVKEMESTMTPTSVLMYQQEITLDNLLMLDDLRAKFMSLNETNKNKVLTLIDELCQTKQ